MNSIEFCRTMAGLDWKDCYVFIQRHSNMIAITHRYKLHVDDVGMECDELGLSVAWPEILDMAERGEMENWPQGNSTILRLGKEEFKITVFMPMNMEDM
jgi:hypothetical protein